MASNPIEESKILSYLLGLGVIAVMGRVGLEIGYALLPSRYAQFALIGSALGMLGVFLVFVVVYSSFDRMVGPA